MEHVRNTILGGAIPNNFWREILFAMTHLSNLIPTPLLDGLSLYKSSTELLPQLNHSGVLSFIIYVFIYVEERKANFAK